ncbi:hypothetical protein BH18ACT11_BH18ACT11_19850 [soil metagenome]
MLLHSTDCESGLENDAMWNRGVVAVICLLVALGSLLCVGKVSLAKQPLKAPEPGGRATIQRSTSQGQVGARNADNRAPAARPEPATRGPASPPTHKRPAQSRPVDQGTPAWPAHERPIERGAPGRGRLAEPPGRRISLLKKPAHEPPVSREHGRGLGPQRPVRPDTVRPHPRPADNTEPVSHPDHQRPTPRPASGHKQGNESTGRPEGAGSQGQHGEPASPPGREITHSGGSGSGEPPQQTGQPPGYGASAVPKAHHEGVGNPAGSGKAPEGNSPVYTGQPANAPDGGQPGMEANQPPAPRTHAQTRAGSEGGPGARDGAEPAYRPATTRNGAPGPRSSSVQSEEPEAFSVHPPDKQAVIEASVPATQPDGKQLPAGHQAQSASETPLWSTTFLLDPLWVSSGSVVQQAKELLRSLRDGTRDLAAGKLYGKSLTQRWWPPEIPKPFSGFGPMIGGSATGSTSSSGGSAPLLAVIVSCLFALLCLGRSRAHNPFLRPGTVPRLALERPG